MMQIESRCSEQPVQLPKEVWIGWISSAVEAYNMAIYSFLAPLLAMTIFQKSSEADALFFSYVLVFIGSCFLYPLGSFYYGFLGDKEGRQKTCIYSTLGLAVATGLMGLVPIGFLADASWICFLVLLCTQYFFSGGEYYGSIVFSLEHADNTKKHEGLLSALSCLFAVFGLVAANGMASVSIAMGGEMWIRACFLAGGVGGLISYLLKNYCRETPVFTAIMKESLSMDWISFFQSEWKKVLRATMVFAFFMVSYSFIFIFLPLIPLSEGLGHNFDTFKSLIAYGFFLLAAGWLADRIGVCRTMSIGMICFSILIIPLCYLCSDLLVLQLVLTVCACLAIGPIHSWMLQLFEPSHRCRGIFMSSALAIALFSGSTVPICLMILETSQSLFITSIYPFVISLASLLALLGSQTVPACFKFDLIQNS